MTSDGKGLTQSIRHYLIFGNNYRAIQKRNDQPILPIIAESKTGSFYKVFPRQTFFRVPNEVKVYLRPFKDGSYIFRLHNTDPKLKVLKYLFRNQFISVIHGHYKKKH